MSINGKTRLLGVFGYPISHTRSPAMHNPALRRFGFNLVYVPFLVKPENLGQAVQGVRALDLAGINVTIPHKQAIVKHLDEISKESRLIGAANTVINRNGKLFGTTTDPYGIIMALKKGRILVRNKRVLILGTGGTARTALFTLLMEGCAEVVIAGRRPEKAEIMVQEAKKAFKKPVRLLKLHTEAFFEEIEKTNLLINTTSVGMDTSSREILVEKKRLHSRLAVFDIVYQKKGDTPLIRAAKSLGLKCAVGMDMLIYQGMASFKLWTGKNPGYELFRKGFLAK